MESTSFNDFDAITTSSLNYCAMHPDLCTVCTPATLMVGSVWMPRIKEKNES